MQDADKQDVFKMRLQVRKAIMVELYHGKYFKQITC